MITFEETLSTITHWPPYGVPQAKKEALYGLSLYLLTQHHRQKCPEYDQILSVIGEPETKSLSDCPMLPVSLFKRHRLSSIAKDDVYKTVASSSTTGQMPSQVELDIRTSMLQQQVLVNIVTEMIGPKRLPMLIIDTKEVLKNHRIHSARAAGILGFSVFSSERCFALDENRMPDLNRIHAFLDKHKGKPLLVFGFTFNIWQYLCEYLRLHHERLDLSNAFLIHGGGWKKLQNLSVSDSVFAEQLKETCQLTQISNYYGMAEQTGTIYMTCPHGHLHASSYSDIIIRNMADFSICPIGQEGVIQVVTPIALSYPGHSLLTEDKGILLGIDDCPCGRKGKYFKITGRIPHSEIRGCSNVESN